MQACLSEDIETQDGKAEPSPSPLKGDVEEIQDGRPELSPSLLYEDMEEIQNDLFDERHRANRCAPARIRRILFKATEDISRGVIFLWSPPSENTTPWTFRFVKAMHKNILSIHSDPVHVAPPKGMLGPKIELPSVPEEVTHMLTMIVLPGFEPSPRVRRLPNMDVFLRAAIGYCGLCAVCRHPVQYTTLGVPYAISKEILALEYVNVWADKLSDAEDSSEPIVIN